MAKISICVPYHDTPKTAFYLSRLLQSISQQSFKDFEIILTNEPGMAHNHNAAILKAKGEIIQMMQMDDYFAHPNALGDIVDGFGTEYGVGPDGWFGVAWQISASLHDVTGQIGWPHHPLWTSDIYTGNNRLGSISTLSMRKESALLFEEPLQWLIDVDQYYRMYLRWGLPHFLQAPAVVIDTRNDRLTHTLTEQLKESELEYLMKKYGTA